MWENIWNSQEGKIINDHIIQFLCDFNGSQRFPADVSRVNLVQCFDFRKSPLLSGPWVSHHQENEPIHYWPLKFPTWSMHWNKNWIFSVVINFVFCPAVGSFTRRWECAWCIWPKDTLIYTAFLTANNAAGRKTNHPFLQKCYHQINHLKVLPLKRPFRDEPWEAEPVQLLGWETEGGRG